MSFADLWDLRQVIRFVSMKAWLVWLWEQYYYTRHELYNVVQSLLEWLWLYIVNYCTDEIHHFGKTIVWNVGFFHFIVYMIIRLPERSSLRCYSFYVFCFWWQQQCDNQRGVGDDGGSTTRTQPGKEKFKFQYSILTDLRLVTSKWAILWLTIVDIRGCYPKCCVV